MTHFTCLLVLTNHLLKVTKIISFFYTYHDLMTISLVKTTSLSKKYPANTLMSDYANIETALVNVYLG